MRRAVLALSLPLLLVSALPVAAAGDAAWPQFRGPGASGVVERPAPVEWDVPAGENVLWKAPVPGLGLSSPVVWGDLVFLTTAVSGAGDDSLKVGLYGDIAPVKDDSVHRWLLLAYDRATGEERWRRVVHEGVPAIKRHTKSSHANPTAAVDAERVVAFFGSEGLHAFTHAGEPLWSVDFGVLDSGFYMAPAAQWGFASSPVLHDGKVIVQADVMKGSFVAALDAADGRVLWKTARKEVPTWGTPTVVATAAGEQVVVNGYQHFGGYDLTTGEALWWGTGGGDIPVPTPVAADGLVFLTSAHGVASPVIAVRPTARGEVKWTGDAKSDAVAWSVERGGAYMQTPLVKDGLLYVCRDNGVLSVYRAATGERLYQERLGDGGTGFTASAVAAGGHVYFTGESGAVHVVAAGPEFRHVAENPLGEAAMATPAAVDGVLYFRTQRHLVAVGGPGARPAETPPGEAPPEAPAGSAEDGATP